MTQTNLTIIVTFALAGLLAVSVNAYAPEESPNLERYSNSSITLEASSKDIKEAISLEQSEYEKKDPLPEPLIEEKVKAPNTSSFNEHELRIFNECTAMDMTLEQTAFVLANARHETAQYKYLTEIDGANQAIRLGYKGGANWYGRGYIQLTHNTNYAQWSKWTGVDLVSNPDLLITDLDLSASIACSGIKFGSFTAKAPVSEYINDHKKDYFNARDLVNGDKWYTDRTGMLMGNKIAGYTQEYINKLNN
jgi:hypothetical protein